jgi:hypothetical protein
MFFNATVNVFTTVPVERSTDAVIAVVFTSDVNAALAIPDCASTNAIAIVRAISFFILLTSFRFGFLTFLP